QPLPHPVGRWADSDTGEADAHIARASFRRLYAHLYRRAAGRDIHAGHWQPGLDERSGVMAQVGANVPGNPYMTGCVGAVWRKADMDSIVSGAHIKIFFGRHAQRRIGGEDHNALVTGAKA